MNSFCFFNFIFNSRRSWLLRQLFPRSLLEQFSMKQLIHRIRQHLVEHEDIIQLTVAKQFIRIFSENTRSFGGKLFPVKFPVRLYSLVFRTNESFF